MKIVRPAIRYHGGKFRLAAWLLRFFPPHRFYTEAFGGAAGVLLQKPRAEGEVYNDLDGDVVNFFRVLRDPVLRARLEEAVLLTPFAREEFELASEAEGDEVERARRLCIRAQMGFGSAGATKGSTGLRSDLNRNATADWCNYPPCLAAAGQRFAGVLIENRPAVDVMLSHDGPDTLHFVDPPYMHETRDLGSIGRNGKRKRQYYRHELSDDDHEELLGALDRLEGMVVLSGYETPLYHEALPGWQTHTTRARISGSKGAELRTEWVWLNPACVDALRRGHGGLFHENAA